MINSSRFPARERILNPLKAAVEMLSKDPPDPAFRQEWEDMLVAANTALLRLEPLTTDSQELLDEFVSGFGPIESIMGGAAQSGQRGDAHGNRGHDDDLTRRCTQEMNEDLLSFVAAIAPNDQIAEAHVSKFMTERANDIKELFDLAQKDGWQHGNYRTEATDAASAEMAVHIRSLARTINPSLL